MNVIAIAILLLVGFPPPVAARILVDGNDVRGRLDLKSVSFQQIEGVEGRVHLKFRWTMFEDWTIHQCKEAQLLEDGCVVRIALDTRGSPAWRPSGRGIDYNLFWRPSGCGVQDAHHLSSVAQGAAHKGARSATCTIVRDRLVVKKKIRWYAATQWANDDLGWYATDYVPNLGWVP